MSVPLWDGLVEGGWVHSKFASKFARATGLTGHLRTEPPRRRAIRRPAAAPRTM
ncbi:hypothetical protein K788_0000889 [Paraburkholderia caribensis MBA4]|uniref:Uncharacterized protein n=1 Tax=Paraburkholderia caribensis MBA4 TaxID=1323664 RepID=A0A0P0RH21_9BURK|nr:hypothetical protein K788_0000889 [Paraburkholderia caribensis MBA4]